MSSDDEDDAESLSIGTVVGGATPESRAWHDAIKQVRRSVDEAGGEQKGLLNLNIVFHVPGDIWVPDFEGARTGSYSPSLALLMVQVALPSEVPSDPATYLWKSMRVAIAEAESWAGQRKVPMDGDALREIVDAASETSSPAGS